MNITRSEIIAAIAGAFAGVAAITSVTAAVNAPKTAGVTEFELGKTTSVEDWSHTPSTNFNRNCSVSGVVTYEVETVDKLTGVVGGYVTFDHGREWVEGTLVNGEGSIRVAVAEFNTEEACDLKKASYLEVESIQLDVTPAIVSAID
jgi:hypothetical protein